MQASESYDHTELQFVVLAVLAPEAECNMARRNSDLDGAVGRQRRAGRHARCYSCYFGLTSFRTNSPKWRAWQSAAAPFASRRAGTRPYRLAAYRTRRWRIALDQVTGTAPLAMLALDFEFFPIWCAETHVLHGTN